MNGYVYFCRCAAIVHVALCAFALWDHYIPGVILAACLAAICWWFGEIVDE